MKFKNKIDKFFDNTLPLVGLTAYSRDMARVLDRYVDFILVGDSLGMTVYGMKNTHGVTLDMMVNHGRAVVNGAKKTLVVIDLPYGTYKRSPLQAYETACKVIEKTKCYGVKIEGGKEMAETVYFLTKRGIKVMGHIGFLPQSVKNYKKIKIKGFDKKEKQELINDASALIHGGVFSIVIEAVAESAANALINDKSIQSLDFGQYFIGIGASPSCKGQILVTDDMLGLTENRKINNLPKFVKIYKNNDFEESIKQFCKDVKEGVFPSKDYCYLFFHNRFVVCGIKK